MADKDKYGPGFKPPKPIPMSKMFQGLTDEQLEDLKAALKAGKRGFSYDNRTKQYGFKFRDGGEVCRGQGRVRKQRKFRVT